MMAAAADKGSRGGGQRFKGTLTMAEAAAKGSKEPLKIAGWW
jgi:hypothetical protein